MRKIPFAKILIGFAVGGVLSLGMCGVSTVMALSAGGSHAIEVIVPVVAVLSILGMVISGLGVFVTGIVWIVSSASRSSNQDKNLP